MGVRKNARHLDSTEKNYFVRALLLMKADIVNPGAAEAAQFSVYDRFIALHSAIQTTTAPDGLGGHVQVNFGHGDEGFFPWHRKFLHSFEQALQSYVPGVTIPYWDWSDPSPLLTDDFLGPPGKLASSWRVPSGYFAYDAPGTGANPTPALAWWPAALKGWRIASSITVGSLQSELKRGLGNLSQLPGLASIRSAMSKPTYPLFRLAVERGSANVSPAARMHDGLHTWWGNSAHMYYPAVSPADPLFWLHHCNIDRLWAMWQQDGHWGDAWYPVTGAIGHRLDDPMYPWVSNPADYTPGNSFGIDISVFTGSQLRARDVLDHRALGYSYDTQLVVGVALDRSGSMNRPAPDPLVTSGPATTKWLAAVQGVSAFLNDADAARGNVEAYVDCGVETFRSNDFAPVFAGAGWGLVKAGGSISPATFGAAMSPLAPGGGTPLADALSDVRARYVLAPYGGLHPGERRYIVFFTDGKETSGAPLASIAAGAWPDAGIFAMGFGTGADVDYAAITGLAGKGANLSVTQVFHGENVGAIDKFFGQSFAAMLQYVPLVDPVLELFDGEHVHVPFAVSGAETSLAITAQGLDYVDGNWSFALHGPGGLLFDERPAHEHPQGHDRQPVLSVARSGGRLSVFVSRNGAADHDWVGLWELMIRRRSPDDGVMRMPAPGEILSPAGTPTLRGLRYGRLLDRRAARVPERSLQVADGHAFSDIAGTATNLHDGAAKIAVNISARSALRMRLIPVGTEVGDKLTLKVDVEGSGSFALSEGFARLIAPTVSVGDLLADIHAVPLAARKEWMVSVDGGRTLDVARALGAWELAKGRAVPLADTLTRVVSHHGPVHAHVPPVTAPGLHHAALWIEGTWTPTCSATKPDDPHHDGESHAGGVCGACGGDHQPQRVQRVLGATFVVPARVDPHQSRAVFRRKGHGIQVVVFARDALGRLVPPGTAMSILINGVQLTIPARIGQHGLPVFAVPHAEVHGAEVRFPTEASQRLGIDAGPVRCEVAVGDVKLSVTEMSHDDGLAEAD